ncbi:MAG: hypothetical protein ABUK01_16175 [Leptospirales bacterium]
MEFSKIIIVYKKSTYHMYKEKPFFKKLKNKNMLLYDQLVKAHDEHYASVDLLLKQLEPFKNIMKVHKRGINRMPTVKPNDLVISLGGDGTFIYTSHSIKEGAILGVNSAPDFSVGHYCRLNVYDKKSSLRNYVEEILSGKRSPQPLSRLQFVINEKPVEIPIVNDALLIDKNPATTTRYILKWNEKLSQQKSSGIWISTATGSSAAFSSAGGKRFKQTDNKNLRQFGFVVREMYSHTGDLIRGGMVKEGDSLEVDFGTIFGQIFIDGGQKQIPLNIGDEISVRFHPNNLNTFLPGGNKRS